MFFRKMKTQFNIFLLLFYFHELCNFLITPLQLILIEDDNIYPTLMITLTLTREEFIWIQGVS
jgi:hypothetical protein